MNPNNQFCVSSSELWMQVSPLGVLGVACFMKIRAEMSYTKKCQLEATDSISKRSKDFQLIQKLVILCYQKGCS